MVGGFRDWRERLERLWGEPGAHRVWVSAGRARSKLLKSQYARIASSRFACPPRLRAYAGAWAKLVACSSCALPY